MRASILVIAMLLNGLSACASTPRSGPCPEKPLINACSPGFHESCETDDDGCEQCGCVPTSDDQGRPFSEPY